VTARLGSLPGVHVVEPQATYLAWIDVRGVAVPGAQVAEVPPRAVHPLDGAFRAGGVRLSPGADFGPGGAGFVRLNFATSVEVLTEALERIAAVVLGSQGDSRAPGS
jgi:cysteine-S-conjugate beta-lyase